MQGDAWLRGKRQVYLFDVDAGSLLGGVSGAPLGSARREVSSTADACLADFLAGAFFAAFFAGAFLVGASLAAAFLAAAFLAGAFLEPVHNLVTSG